MPLFSTIISQQEQVIGEALRFDSSQMINSVGLHMANLWGLEMEREDIGDYKIGGHIKRIDASTEIEVTI